MSELVLLHIRSLCYGVAAAFYAFFAVRMVDGLHRNTAPHARFIFVCSAIAMGILSFVNCIWFVFDFLDKNTGMWFAAHQRLYMSVRLVELLIIPTMGAALLCLSRLKRFRYRNMALWMGPFIVFPLLYLVSGYLVLAYIAFAFMFTYTVIINVMAVYNVKQFETLLNNTYANTSHRGVRWVYTLLGIFATLFVFWLSMIYVVGDVMGDIIYIVIGFFPWAYYVSRVYKQNFDIAVMRDIVESGEDVDEGEPAPETVAAAGSDQVAYIDVEQHAVLKKWQEPDFDEAVRHFCSDSKNFTNSELSVQDVANGVGSNRTYVSRWCKEQGMDFSSYITGIRLVYAEQMLVNTDKPIVEIVDLSGFSNPRYFRVVFSAKYGCSPSEYRTLHSTIDKQ